MRPSLWEQLTAILRRHYPEHSTVEEIAEELHALVIELYGPPF